MASVRARVFRKFLTAATFIANSARRQFGFDPTVGEEKLLVHMQDDSLKVISNDDLQALLARTPQTFTGENTFDAVTNHNDNVLMKDNRIQFQDPILQQFLPSFIEELTAGFDSALKIVAAVDLEIRNGEDDSFGNMLLRSENDLILTSISSDITLNTSDVVIIASGKIFQLQNAAQDTLIPISNSGGAGVSALQIGALIYPIVDGTSGQVMVTDGAGNISFATASTGYADGRWDATTISQSPPPISGRVRWNNATQINSTEIYINYTTTDGIDGTDFIQSLISGDRFIISAVGSTNIGQQWKISSNVDNTTYATLTATLSQGTAQFTQGQELNITFQSQAAGAITVPGGVEGDIQFKSGDDFAGGGPNWNGTNLAVTGGVLIPEGDVLGITALGGIRFKEVLSNPEVTIFMNDLEFDAGNGAVQIGYETLNTGTVTLKGGATGGSFLTLYGPTSSIPGASEHSTAALLLGSNPATDSDQFIIINGKHSTSLEEDISIIRLSSTSLNPTQLAIGGGHSSYNAIEIGALYAAADDTTLDGTQIVTWNINGLGVVTGNITLNNGPTINTGSGTPEGAVTAPVGSTFHRTDGGAGTSFYVKESGVSNTGWVGK